MRKVFAALAVVLSCATSAFPQAIAPLRLNKTLPLKGVTGRFDHFAFDAAGNRLFIAATGHHSVEVLNVVNGNLMESIPDLGKPHGLAWVADQGKLFVADGTLAALKVYAGSPFRLVASIALSDDADDMIYDENTKLLYVGHGGSSDAIPGRIAIVNTRDNTLVANLPASAHPEALEIDPNGKRIFANIADSGEVVVIDAATHAITQTWKISRARDNVPAAYDADDNVLLLGCRTPATALALDAATGQEVSVRPSAAGADDFFYEPASRRAYLISGSGTVDVYQVSADKTLESLGGIKTGPGAKTGLLVRSIGTLFVGVPSAGNEPAEIRMYSTIAAK